MNIKNKRQLLCNTFLEKYNSLDLYDEDLEKIFIIDHKELEFDKNYGWTLIGIPPNPDGYLPDHEYFCIHDDIFDRIQSIHQNNNISLKIITNEPNVYQYQCDTTEICDDKICN